MSFAHHSDADRSDCSCDRYSADQILSDPRMLARLERSSKQYLLGSRPESLFDGICAKCSALVCSPDEESFDEELERLVREEGRTLLQDLLDEVASSEQARGHRGDESDSQWPLVELAVAEALGEDAADRIGEGLRLLSWRNLLSSRYGKLQEASADEQIEGVGTRVDIPDPEIWNIKHSVLAADVCFVAVSTLLGQRKNVPPRIGTRIADVFYEGQRNSVRFLASILSSHVTDKLVEVAVRFADVDTIDIGERYRQASDTNNAARDLIRSHGGLGIITPFPLVDDDYVHDDYPDDDPDEWVSIAEMG